VNGFCARTGTVLATVAATIVLAPATGAAGRDRLELREGRALARETVLAHETYRVIHHPSPLRTRSCWRVSDRRVRCSLEATVGFQCYLAGPPPPDALCAAVTGYRRWVVQVRDGRRPRAHIVSVSSG
jgi:hypothetical protein